MKPFLPMSRIEVYDLADNCIAAFAGDNFKNDSGNEITLPELWASYPKAVGLAEITSRGRVRQAVPKR